MGSSELSTGIVLALHSIFMVSTSFALFDIKKVTHSERGYDGCE